MGRVRGTRRYKNLSTENAHEQIIQMDLSKSSGSMKVSFLHCEALFGGQLTVEYAW